MPLVYSQRVSVCPCGALIFVMASGFNCMASSSHINDVCSFPSTCESCVLLPDVKGNRFELFWTMGVIQTSPVQIFIAWCFMGGGKICKKHRAAFPGVPQTGILGLQRKENCIKTTQKHMNAKISQP